MLLILDGRTVKVTGRGLTRSEYSWLWFFVPFLARKAGVPLRGNLRGHMVFGHAALVILILALVAASLLWWLGYDFAALCVGVVGLPAAAILGISGWRGRRSSIGGR